MVQDIPASSVPEGAAAPPTVRCGPADLDQISSVWDRKSEGWRRAVVSATRALHQVSCTMLTWALSLMPCLSINHQQDSEGATP